MNDVEKAQLELVEEVRREQNELDEIGLETYRRKGKLRK